MTIPATAISPGWQVKDCPPSATADKIVTWAEPDGSLNVEPGDLVLVQHMERVEAIAYDPPADECVTVWFTGHPAPICMGARELVAVRRYVEG